MKLINVNTLKNRILAVVVVSSLTLSLFSLSAKEPSAALDLARQLNKAFIEVADNVSPAVVVIKVAHKPDYREQGDEDNPLLDMVPRQFRRQLEEQMERRRSRSREPIFDGQGSGIVIREDGYILSNRHVVEGADKIKVHFKDGKEYDAEIRGVDSQSDIAVVKINAKGLTVAKLGDSTKTRVGEFAIAIGAPFELENSVTFGHVSAKGRSGVIPAYAGGDKMDQDFIQTDASINPGNSGGPLINIDGEVIGINTLIRGLNTGIGFAIPINLAKEVAGQLITDGKFTRAQLGIRIASLKDYEDYRGLVKGVEEGVVVDEIVPKGPAARSELKPADVITAVDGKPVATAQQLKNEIRSKKIGQPVSLDVFRDGKNLKIKVQTEAWGDENIPVVNRRKSGEDSASQNLGLKVEALTKQLADQFGVKIVQGVIVTEVESGSAADLRQIKPGDIITEINRKSVTNPRQFRDALKEADLKKGVVINFISDGASKFRILKDSGD